MSSALSNLSELLNLQGIEVTVDDLFKLQIIQWQNSERQRITAIRLECYQMPINNGKSLLIIGAAVLGFGIALALGAGLATAIAIGAAVGYKLFRAGQKKQQQKQVDRKQERVVNASGFDSAPSPPSVGGVIPIHFCNTAINPLGGLRISSSVVFSRINTVNNKQSLQLLRAVGLGAIANVNASKLLIDNQPTTNFSQDEISIQYSTGSLDQARFPQISVYSQAASLSNQNTFGFSIRGTFITVAGNVATVSADDFDLFTPADLYEVTGQQFRVINKNAPANQLFLNRNLSIPANSKVYARSEASFRTLKRCTQLEINFVFDIWARNDKSELIKFAIAFSLFIDGAFLGNFYESNSKEGLVRRAVTINNLALKQHQVKIVPLLGVGNPFYRLDDSGVIRNINSGVVLDEKQPVIVIESKPENQLPAATIDGQLNQTNKPQKSADRGPIGRISSFNQIVYPSDIGQQSVTNYPGLKLAFNDFVASDRLSGSPATSDFIEQSELTRNHIAAGKASPNSHTSILIANGIDLSGCRVAMIVRNLTRQTESPITQILGAQVACRDNLNWRAGDDFLIFYLDAIAYFPDAYVFTLLNPYCLGGVVKERFIDYPSICRSRRFCELGNYFYNDSIDSVINWDEWAQRESTASLLFPTDYSGNYGLLPEEFTEPTAIFSASNIMPGTYRENPPEQRTINCVQLTYNDREDDGFLKKTLTAMTGEAWFGTEPLRTESIEFESISRESQARSVAAKYLKSRLIQNKVIQFKTGLGGFSLEAGDLAIVQYTTTEREAEFSAFAWNATPLTGNAQTVELSNLGPLQSGYTANIYHLVTGNIQKNKPIIPLGNGLVSIGNLTEGIQPRNLQYNGDIVIVNKRWEDRLFRVTTIEPDKYSVQVSAIYWTPDILTENGLYFVL